MIPTVNPRWLLFVIFTMATGLDLSGQGRTTTVHRLDSERAAQDVATQIDILEAALRFYRPLGSQSRWLDRQVMPETANSAVSTLPPVVVDTLIERLGPGRFCASDDRLRCRFRQGGRVRVSQPYLSDATHARVIVEFEGVWPYGPSIVSTQVLHLAREGSGWRIGKRYPL